MSARHAAAGPSRRRFLIIAAVVAASASGLEAQEPIASHLVAPPVVSARVVATVNGVAIREDRLAQAVNALMPMEAFHKSVSADKVAEVRRKAADRLIDEELRYQDGVKRGIKVPSSDIDRRVAELTRQYGGAAKLAAAERRAGVTRLQLRAEIQRALTVQKVFADVVTAQCQVTQADAAVFYRDNPSRFVQPEQLHVFAITIGVDPSSNAAGWAAAKKKAEEVLARLRQGLSFEAAARSFSTDPTAKSGGDMGYAHRGSLNDAFEKAATGLRVGEPSEVIKTLYGFHIIRIADVRAPRTRPFAEVSAELRKDLTSRKCADTESAWSIRLRAAAKLDLAGLTTK